LGFSFTVSQREGNKTGRTDFETLSEKLENIFKSIGCKSYVFCLRRHSLTQELCYQGFFTVLVKKRQRTLLKVFENAGLSGIEILHCKENDKKQAITYLKTKENCETGPYFFNC